MESSGKAGWAFFLSCLCACALGALPLRYNAALADGSCTAQQAVEAERLAASAQSWEKLHSLFRSYEQCDDGPVVARFSESVSRLLIGRWDRLSELRQLSSRDPKFEAFVLRHVDESVPAERLRALNTAATTKCPSSESEFCQRLVQRLREL
jgi:hypothetical protein